MTLWARVRDGVLARVREGGRQYALALVEALRERVGAGRTVLVVGGWRDVFAALGLSEPRCAKTAIRALGMLAELAGGAVQRLGARGHRWWVSSASDPQLGLDLDPRDRNSESDPDGPRPAPQPAPPVHRTPARTLALDLAGRSLAAAELAARVTETGALERGEAFAVTLTVPEGGDLAAVVEAFAAALAGPGRGALLVPEVAGQLHAHGVAIAGAEQVDAALRACGAGHSVVRPLTDVRRWAGYCCKRWTGEEIASGVLAGGDGDGADEHVRADRGGSGGEPAGLLGAAPGLRVRDGGGGRGGRDAAGDGARARADHGAQPGGDGRRAARCGAPADVAGVRGGRALRAAARIWGWLRRAVR